MLIIEPIMLISAAVAQDTTSTLAAPDIATPTAATAPGSPIASLFPLLLIFVVFYFLMIRPQQKKYKAHQEMIKNLKRGDKVITGGGIIGTVSKIESDDIVSVEIASGMVVQVARATIANVSGKEQQEQAAEAPAAPARKDKKQVANDN